MRVNLDACIQCGLCVRACREVQVNDVIGMAFRNAARESGVRPRRSDGRVHLRGLRRVRAGLPDRRADASRLSRCGAAPHRLAGAQRGLAVPVLRRRLPGDVSRRRREDRLCRRARRAGQPQPALREGTVRLRLHPPPAPADPAAGAPRRRAEDTRGIRSIRPIRGRIFAKRAGTKRWIWPPPGSRASATRRAGGRWPGSARPKGRTRKPICSRSWCAPASARTMSITARGCAMPRRSRR